MKKSDFVFVLKIFALGVLLFCGFIQDQGAAPNAPHPITASDTVRNALYPEGVYLIKESTPPHVFTWVKK